MEIGQALSLGCTVFLALCALAIFCAQKVSHEEKRMAARFLSIQPKRGPAELSVAEIELLHSEGSGEIAGLAFVLKRLFTLLNIERLLRQADSTVSAKKLLLTCGGAGITGVVCLMLFLPNAGLAFLAGMSASYLPIIFFQVQKKRRIMAFDKALPDAIEMMSRSLRAGHSMIAAISIVAEHAAEPVRTEFGEVFRKQNFGLPLRDALMFSLEQIPSQDLRLLVTGILVQKDTGGNLAEILDRIVSVIRERLKIQGEINVHTAQGRLTGWILCLMPVGLMIILNVINPGYSKPLTNDPLGIKVLYGGVALLLFGAYLIKRIIDAIEV